MGIFHDCVEINSALMILSATNKHIGNGLITLGENLPAYWCFWELSPSNKMEGDFSFFEQYVCPKKLFFCESIRFSIWLWGLQPCKLTLLIFTRSFVYIVMLFGRYRNLLYEEKKIFVHHFVYVSTRIGYYLESKQEIANFKLQRRESVNSFYNY